METFLMLEILTLLRKLKLLLKIIELIVVFKLKRNGFPMIIFLTSQSRNFFFIGYDILVIMLLKSLGNTVFCKFKVWTRLSRLRKEIESVLRISMFRSMRIALHTKSSIHNQPNLTMNVFDVKWCVWQEK